MLTCNQRPPSHPDAVTSEGSGSEQLMSRWKIHAKLSRSGPQPGGCPEASDSVRNHLQSWLRVVHNLYYHLVCTMRN